MIFRHRFKCAAGWSPLPHLWGPSVQAGETRCQLQGASAEVSPALCPARCSGHTKELRSWPELTFSRLAGWWDPQRGLGSEEVIMLTSELFGPFQIDLERSHIYLKRTYMDQSAHVVCLWLAAQQVLAIPALRGKHLLKE